ncbi:MAG TPA: SAM-dependent methyltransferase [Hyphomicrobiaceae bacterium]|nr:SAM-dependent methyltransferase [Hyphomicrobiaceae bacterium]
MPERQADQPSLLAEVSERIRRDGPMPVDSYMEACLRHYYRSRQSIGAGGDFVTAPEISQVFGELIGLWCAVVWESMGRPEPLRLIELGPGRGALMADAVRAGRALPGFLNAIAVHLVETSPLLRQAQQAALARAGVPLAWHEAVEEVPAGAAIVIANELIDALPIRQLVYLDGAWHERVVALGTDGQLQFAAGPSVAFSGSVAPTPGAIAELRPGEEAVLAALAARTEPLIALFIDYGPVEPALGDTLQAVRGHAYAEPLAAPGLSDLTAHVQFTALAEKARVAGLAADGPMTQAQFLGGLGIVERTARLMAANPVRAGEIEAATQRLMSPGGMGQLFKVLAVRSPHLPAPPPFG